MTNDKNNVSTTDAPQSSQPAMSKKKTKSLHGIM